MLMVRILLLVQQCSLNKLNLSGKGKNIQDRLTHSHPKFIKDESNGDVACNSYYKYKEDVQLLKGLGVNFYRFSLSQSRILPSGLCSSYNQKGIDYYHNVIDKLIKNYIMPMITFITGIYLNFFKTLADGQTLRLLTITQTLHELHLLISLIKCNSGSHSIFNEPNPICRQGYRGIGKSPALESNGFAEYLCAYHLLKSHANTCHIFNNEYRSVLNGKF